PIPIRKMPAAIDSLVARGASRPVGLARRGDAREPRVSIAPGSSLSFTAARRAVTGRRRAGSSRTVSTRGAAGINIRRVKLPPGGHVHLIGICGTAMAGLAGLLRARGYRVTGSDEGVYPPMSTWLESLGIQADSGFDVRNLHPDPGPVVSGNAIRRGNPEAEDTLDRRLPFTSLPVLMKELMLPGTRPVVVAGTHGKTTTSSMLAHVLSATGADPSFLIGGIPLGAGAPSRLGKGDVFVLEGDEYDTAFF